MREYSLTRFSRVLFCQLYPSSGLQQLGCRERLGAHPYPSWGCKPAHSVTIPRFEAAGVCKLFTECRHHVGIQILGHDERCTERSEFWLIGREAASEALENEDRQCRDIDL